MQRLAQVQLSLDGGTQLRQQVPSLHANYLEFSFPLPNTFPEGPRKRCGCRCKEYVCPPQESLPAVGTTAVERKMVPAKHLPLLQQGIETSEQGGFSLLVPTTLKGIFGDGQGQRLQIKKSPNTTSFL